MSKKITVLVDGGHLRVYLKKANKPVTADYIDKVVLACALATEEIVRILYYDCALFNGTTRLPVSRGVQTHAQATPLLHDLAQKDLFAVRRGMLKFRGYVIKRNHQPSNPPVDADFAAKIQFHLAYAHVNLHAAQIHRAEIQVGLAGAQMRHKIDRQLVIEMQVLRIGRMVAAMKAARLLDQDFAAKTAGVVMDHRLGGAVGVIEAGIHQIGRPSSDLQFTRAHLDFDARHLRLADFDRFIEVLHGTAKVGVDFAPAQHNCCRRDQSSSHDSHNYAPSRHDVPRKSHPAR